MPQCMHSLLVVSVHFCLVRTAGKFYSQDMTADVAVMCLHVVERNTATEARAVLVCDFVAGILCLWVELEVVFLETGVEELRVELGNVMKLAFVQVVPVHTTGLSNLLFLLLWLATELLVLKLAQTEVGILLQLVTGNEQQVTAGGNCLLVRKKMVDFLERFG